MLQNTHTFLISQLSTFPCSTSCQSGQRRVGIGARKRIHYCGCHCKRALMISQMRRIREEIEAEAMRTSVATPRTLAIASSSSNKVASCINNTADRRSFPPHAACNGVSHMSHPERYLPTFHGGGRHVSMVGDVTPDFPPLPTILSQHHHLHHPTFAQLSHTTTQLSEEEMEVVDEGKLVATISAPHPLLSGDPDTSYMLPLVIFDNVWTVQVPRETAV